MVLHLRRAFSSLLLMSLIFIAQSQEKPEFPKLSELEIEFYQTDVIVTIEDQQVYAFASEYFDSTGGPRGRLDTTVLGQKQSIFYNNGTGEIFEVDATKCDVWDIGDSIYSMQPVFYGWLNKDPLIIGPSAPFWYAEDNRDRIEYLGSDFVIRDITCDKFALNFADYEAPGVNMTDNVTYYFYFANKDWKTPYYVKDLRVPIRIEVTGISSKNSESIDEWVSINQITDFVFFRPDISDWSIFQPPEGLGCPLRKKTREMPAFPKVFQFSAEVVDLLKAESQEISEIEYQRMWYDYKEKLARIDKYTRQRRISEFYDFKNGVTYSNVDGQTCEIKPLRNSFFEHFGNNKMMGRMDEPEEVLGLKGDFYYRGKKLIRGIWCDVFEIAKHNETFMKQTFAKLVVTVYYSQQYYFVAVEGETEIRVPVFYAVKGYDEKSKVIMNLQYNIFGFDDVVYPDMYASFRLERCYPSLHDKAYFVMIMNVQPELAAKMEDQDAYVLLRLRQQITEIANVSNHRLPLLRADYKTTGVFVTGQLLDRPPALKQFWLEFEGEATTNDPYLRAIPWADTKEKCAFGCVDYFDFKCTGFFWCSETCFIKSKDILDPIDDDKNYNFGGKCQEWLRAESDSKNDDSYLADALDALQDAVMNLTIKVNIKFDARSTIDVPVTDIDIEESFIGDGHEDKPYDVIMKYAKLKAGDETTQAFSYIDNLNDCYKACKDSQDLSCSSFSYCADSSNKQCLISSVLVVDKKRNADDTDPDPNCFVYSMKYLDYYDAYPGRLALIPGAEVITGVKSTEECAKNCRQATKIACRGFEYCHTEKSCVLHTKHVLDLNSGEVVTNKKTTCIHYAARYSADYLDMGYTLVDDKSDVRSAVTLEECAKTCSEELKDKCNSFNYCPNTDEYANDRSCAVSSLTLTSPRVTTTKKIPCHHYEKKSKVDDWGKSRGVKTPIVTSGYTSGGFTGLVIGMLILGFALGAAGFVGYSYFKSKSSGEGMTVRFMKQDNA